MRLAMPYNAVGTTSSQPSTMPQSILTVVRRFARVATVGAISAVLMVQAVNTCVLMARGPAHFHVGPASSLALSDFRRVDQPLTTVGSAGEVRSAHHHDAAAPQRHHHPLADFSVMRIEADRFADAAAEDGALALDLALFAFMAVAISTPAWARSDVTHRRPLRELWLSLTFVPRLIDRPPRFCC